MHYLKNISINNVKENKNEEKSNVGLWHKT